MRSFPNVGKTERRPQNENIHGTGEYYPYLSTSPVQPHLFGRSCVFWVFAILYTCVLCFVPFTSQRCTICTWCCNWYFIFVTSNATPLRGTFCLWMFRVNQLHNLSLLWRTWMRASCFKNQMLLACTKKFAPTPNEQYIVYNGRCWPVARQNLPFSLWQYRHWHIGPFRCHTLPTRC